MASLLSQLPQTNARLEMLRADFSGLANLEKAIEKVLKLKVVELKTDPQLMGALGAAEYARQKGMAKK